MMLLNRPSLLLVQFTPPPPQLLVQLIIIHTPFIPQLLVQVARNTQIDEPALNECSKMIFSLLEELVTVCAPLTRRDVEDYISRFYPRETYEECRQRALVSRFDKYCLELC